MLKGKGSQIAILYLIACIITALIGCVNGSLRMMFLTLVMMIGLPIVCSSFKRAISVVLLLYFVLDQVSFVVLGGTFKLYFVFSIILFFLFIKEWKYLPSSEILRGLLLWGVVCIIICAFSINRSSALTSYMAVVLQMMAALAIYLVLESNTLDLETLNTLCIKILYVMLIFGLVQYILYRATGIALGINVAITAGQLAVGQIPSFRYEGNAFGKFVGWGVIFCIPALVNLPRNRKKVYEIIMILGVIVSLMSITRAVLYAIVVTGPFVALWYIYKNKFAKVFKTTLVIAALAGFVIIAVQNNIFNLRGYSLYKLQNLFLNVQQATDDGSAGFRLESIKQGYEIWVSTKKNFLVGVGYLQAQGDLSHRGGMSEADVGGCEIIILGVSFGVIGLLLYLRTMLKIIYGCLKTSLQTAIGSMQQIWCERMAFCAIYYVALQAFTGSMLCPEFWMMFGIAAFVAKKSRRIGNASITS